MTEPSCLYRSGSGGCRVHQGFAVGFGAGPSLLITAEGHLTILWIYRPFEIDLRLYIKIDLLLKLIIHTFTLTSKRSVNQKDIQMTL